MTNKQIDGQTLDNQLREIQDLAVGGDPLKAMTQLLGILENDYRNPKAIDLARTILWINGNRLPVSILLDPLLDPLFAQCVSCGKAWVVNPLYDVGAKRFLFLNAPSGGQCNKCNNVYCSDCAGRKNNELYCPNHKFGKPKLEYVIKPNGRTKRNIAPRLRPERLQHVVLFLSPPGPPRIMGYAQIILENNCSEALTDNPIISYTISEKTDFFHILAYFSEILHHLKGYPDYIQDKSKYEVLSVDFADADGGSGVIVMVYNK